MSSDKTSFGVTYTSISSNYEEPSDAGSHGVVVYRYDGLPMHLVDPPSPDYVPGPEQPEQTSLSPNYVPGPEYPEYLAPSDYEIPIEDQPYAAAASPIVLSLANGGDGDDDDDLSVDDANDEEEASDEDEEEEEEYLALAGSTHGIYSVDPGEFFYVAQQRKEFSKEKEGDMVADKVRLSRRVCRWQRAAWRGKDNGENIMKSIKEGPFHMGTVLDVITGRTEGAVQQGPVRARVLNDLSAEEKERYKARKAKTHQCYNYNGLMGHMHGECPMAKALQVQLLQGQDATNASLGENDLALNVDHVFEADECDAFDSDVDEDRNRKETSLKSELHSAQILLSSTVDHYKSKTEEHKVAIGYKNPLCLARAKQAQSALYNGHVLVTTNHTPTVIHDSEDTRELAEITRNRMLLKMQSPLCMENKVRIAPPPPDYSKENFLATFAPQRNLTPEQIFWSIDDNNRKKAETLAPKPISALTVYPPNTPVKLVPRILPTKSQVKINLYVLTQLFTEFDKTCKTRITPTGITEGERGFEQTKRCYLTEVIPFFKTLKEHFVGVQTALFKEVKEMEEIFDQMNNEVDKNTVDKQCAEIEKKNLLIENENLIVNCLSTQLLYDVEKSRCLDLEADVSKVHDESKLISKLEGECLNLQLKYQHLQESFDNNKSHTVQEAPDFNSFFKIKNLEHQIQEKDNVIRNLKVIVANVNDRSCEPYNAKDVTALIE
ncbi:hypothetical protein Tco_0033581 [Tanacetum coccineum]